ncbi:hypothetical protein Dsin_004475 [Dipteronia sinensis]|uniref:Annexin n=1 Tax=Dipteronia sinensis TaxID=43782 RepID=A0AAE0AVG9_9ROSI|nr:hypothetical protein Dsin_004475 [Dipteronia sinensis]
MASINCPPNASPRDDAMQLHRAFKGFGCDNSAVIYILAHRNYAQRALIQHEYQTIYHEDIMKRLASELSGDFEKSVLLWMQNPAERDATLIRDSLTNAAFNPKPANEVICSRTASMIQSIKQYYHSKFGTTLENDIGHYTSGDHQKILLSLVTTLRYEGPEFDRMAADEDAKALYKAGERKIGTDENTFIRIFSGRSSAHLAYVSFAYANMYGTPLKKVIKKETSGNFMQCLSIILQCAVNPAAYFAKELHKSMKGMGTNDTALIRLIVSRAEIDLHYIKAEYLKKYKKPVQDAVHSETSGNYKKFLLALLG